MRYAEGGAFDKFEAVTVEPQWRKRGASHYTVHRVAILLHDRRDLFLRVSIHREHAVQVACLIARRLGLEVRELPEEGAS
jgi:hypothetical protein